jgi:dTDP-4-amino-4,6-dideoxygalactose transaminase
MRVPFLDLAAEYKAQKKDIDKKVNEVLKSGHFILGKNVSGFEDKAAAYLGAKYALGVASGTDALKIALCALGIKGGDEVITTPFSYIATTEAIVKLKAKPVFCDIDETYNIDAQKIKSCITKKTKAIIVVHLYGQPADMNSILKIAKKHKLYVIEDTAQAFGAKYKKKFAGTLGDIGTYSFFPTKTLSAAGDAGLLSTNNKELYSLLSKLRVHGQVTKYDHELDGYNSRLDEVQAAVLNIKMKAFKNRLKKRKRAAGYYNQLFRKADLNYMIPKVLKDVSPAWCLYTLRAKKRDRLLKYLNKHKIDAAVYYPIPLHLQKVYQDLKYKKGDLPVTDKAAKEVISIPIYPEIREKQQQYVVRCIKNFYK